MFERGFAFARVDFATNADGNALTVDPVDVGDSVIWQVLVHVVDD